MSTELVPITQDEDDTKRHRSWVFVVNRDARAWLEEWRTKDLPAGLTFIGGQLEKVSHEHFQGCVEFKTLQKFDKVKSVLGNNPWLAPRRATFEKAYERYCKKTKSRVEGVDPLERGTKPKGQGARTDLQDVASAVMSSFSLEKVCRLYPTEFVKYPSGLRFLHSLTHKPQVRGRPTVYYLWGPPRIGKSRLAEMMWPEAYIAMDSKEGWFDQYDGEPVVLFNEFSGAFPYREMLSLVDYHRHRQRVKGTFTPVIATTFVFTSNFEFAELYLDQPGSNVAWTSRICEFAGVGTDECTVWGPDAVTAKLNQLLQEREKQDEPARGASPAPTLVVEHEGWYE